jgi:hypothetical protein
MGWYVIKFEKHQRVYNFCFGRSCSEDKEPVLEPPDIWLDILLVLLPSLRQSETLP